MLLDTVLVHPDTHEPIRIDWQNKVILTDMGTGYKAGFNDDVPFILPIQTLPQQSSKIHQDHQTDFDYLDHYQRDAEAFDYFQEFTSRVDQVERNRLNSMITSRIPGDARSILDVGCGSAWLARSMVDGNTTVISMDVSSRNPVEALKRHPHPRHEALIADVFHLPLQENSLDCVVASEIMEHVPDPKLFVEKLIYVLKPGGKLIITTPYDERIQYHLCVHCNKPTPSHAHLHSFNEENIKKLIPGDVSQWNWRTFSHKYMNKVRAYQLMSRFPFPVWKSVDQMANKIWRQSMRMMVEVVK